MGKVLLFSMPKVGPLPVWSPTEEEIGHLGPGSLEGLCQLKQRQHEIHIGILERASIVALVFGMPELAKMNVHDASDALVELTKRHADVRAVLGAYYERKSAVERKVG
jgi:hypothetical protein